MARYHLKYKHIDQRTLELTDRFFAQKPYQASPERQFRLFDTWVHGACIVYGFEAHPHLVVDPTDRDLQISRSRYLPEKQEIRLVKFSASSLFHQFRHHMQWCSEDGYGDPAAMEEDARGWAASLFYTVRPRMYRKAVRAGNIMHVHPEDLLKRRAS